tara:strand:- start:363 stop:671 length:309 start_codon:yes stop_codon:yes gene_type:complete
MIPKSYRAMHHQYPEMMRAYEEFGEATRNAGPLSSREIALVKLAISIGAGLEGASKSHARKAIQAECTAEDLNHVAIISSPTIGFPTMMRAKSWVNEAIQNE